jgi:hypothetical protein
MTKFIGLVTAGALVMAAAASPARADILTWGNPNWVEGSPGTVYVTYSGTPPPSPGHSPVSENVDAGELNVYDSTLGTTYSVFCTDIFDNAIFPSGDDFTLNTVTDYTAFNNGNTAMPFSSTQFNQLKALLNGVSTTNYIVDSITSAAVQVAIWEIENDYSQAPSSYDVSSGVFKATNPSDPAILTDATTLLSDVEGGSPVWNVTNGTLQEWSVTSGNQDFSFLAVNGHSIGVPEPGSLILLASGLAGFAAVRRRRGRA